MDKEHESEAAHENDEGRDYKLTITLVVASLVIVIVGAYLLWGWLHTPPPTNSKVDLARVATASRGASTETPAYRELLAQSNREGELAAQQKNQSFVASIPFEQEPIDLPVSTAKPVQTGRQQSHRDSRSTGQETAAEGEKNQARKSALEDLLKQIQPKAEIKTRPTAIQVASNPYGTEMDGAIAQKWSESLGGGSVRRDIGLTDAQGERAVPIEVVPPYWRVPGTIAVGIDSDNSSTPVLGSIPAGRYAGAVLKAPEGAKLTGDGVVIHFREMAYKGVNYRVDAYALHDETLLANIATDVNNRYMSRIVLPALLSGIGSVGDMYSQANTQVVSNGFSTQTVRPGLPDGQAVVGAIIGGGASQAAKVLSEDAARVPAKQVLVTKGQVVAIQFMRGVYAGDAIAPGQGGETVVPSIPAQQRVRLGDQTSTQPPWRSQSLDRIEAQRQLQEGQ